MKVLFDTSVFVAAIIEPHPLHHRAFPWLKRARSGELDLVIASHTLAELYAVLTTLPVKPKIQPGMACHLIHEDVPCAAKILSLSAADYKATIRRMGDLGLSGGVIYDALIAAIARKSGVDHLLTFNLRDFHRIWPEGKAQIREP